MEQLPTPQRLEADNPILTHPVSVDPESPMLPCLCIPFLTAAMLCGILGFGVLSDGAAWGARTLFVIFLIMFFITLFSPKKPDWRAKEEEMYL